MLEGHVHVQLSFLTPSPCSCTQHGQLSLLTSCATGIPQELSQKDSISTGGSGQESLLLQCLGGSECIHITIWTQVLEAYHVSLCGSTILLDMQGQQGKPAVTVVCVNLHLTGVKAGSCMAAAEHRLLWG